MTVRNTVSHRGWSRVLLFALCAALVPLPVLAAEATARSSTPRAAAATTPAPNLNAAVARAVARDLTATPAPARRRSAQGDVTGAGSGSFFRTPTGVVVLAVFAAGVGYAIYSTQHDRINSPGKQ